MARICAVTGRRPVKGSIINRKGQSKKSGGIGTHVTSITKRKFRPNLQRIRNKTANGGTKRVWLCVKAIKARPATIRAYEKGGEVRSYAAPMSEEQRKILFGQALGPRARWPPT